MSQSKFTPFSWLPEPFHIDGLRHIILSCLPPGSELAWIGVFEQGRPFLKNHIQNIFEDEWYGDADPLYTTQIELSLKMCSRLWHGHFQFTGRDNGEPWICTKRDRISEAVPEYLKVIEEARESAEALESIIHPRLKDLILLHSLDFCNVALSLQPLELAKKTMENIKTVLGIVSMPYNFANSRFIHLSLLIDSLGRVDPRWERMRFSDQERREKRYDEIRGVMHNAWMRGQWDVFEYTMGLLPWNIILQLSIDYGGQDFEGLSLETVIRILKIDTPLPALREKVPMRGGRTLFVSDESGRSFARCFLRGSSLERCKKLISLIHPSRLEKIEYKNLIVENGSAELVSWYLSSTALKGWMPDLRDHINRFSPDVLRLLLPHYDADKLLSKAISTHAEWAVRINLDSKERIGPDALSRLLTRGYVDVFIESKALCSSEGNPCEMIKSVAEATYTRETEEALWKKMADSGIRLTPEQHADMSRYGISVLEKISNRFRYGRGMWWVSEVPQDAAETGRKIPLTLYMQCPKGLTRSFHLHLACSKIPLAELSTRGSRKALNRAIKEEAWMDVSIISRALGNELFRLETVASGSRPSRMAKALRRCRKLHTENTIRGYLHYLSSWHRVMDANLL